MVRVRFAPSPTGHLHIGSLRTALFNFLFARHHNGAFLLRIEDTDLERSKQEYTDSIIRAFAWVGITSDEPIVIQSSRLKEHQKYVQQLLKEGKAYRCYCAQQEYQERSEGISAEGEHYFKYDGHCRNVSPETISDKPFVVRFKIPDDCTHVTFHDLVRGDITVTRDQLDDFIIMRSDGNPIYNFVVVVDDIAMRITHIIRGEDHISNTPKQILLYQALGHLSPAFAHIPLILGPDGHRLSKRNAAVAVTDYQAKGYLPDALCNYLVRLGWSYGDKEIFTRQEMIDYFSLAHVGKSASIFDIEKLDWMNGVYIRNTSDPVLLTSITQLQPDFINQLPHWTNEQIVRAISLYKDRVKTLVELAAVIQKLYQPMHQYDAHELTQWVSKDTGSWLEQVIVRLQKLDVFYAEGIKKVLQEYVKTLPASFAYIAQPIRLALTGTTKSPGIYELLELLGKEESCKRLASFVIYIHNTMIEQKGL